MNYYPRHIGDYAKDTRGLSFAEHGAYGLLLDTHYDLNGGIPDKDKYTLVGARSGDEKAAVDTVLERFFTQNERGEWENSRAMKEIALNQKRADVGRESAAKRWEANGKPMGTHIKPNANQKPKAKSQKINNPPTPPGGFEEGFALWSDYRKSRKLKAYVQATWDTKFEEYRGRPLEFLRDVKYSIGQGYQGIYAPKTPPPTPSRSEVFRSVAEVMADG